MFGKPAPGVLANILGHIAFYCIDNRLPPLTSIVVGKDEGTPGGGIPIDVRAVDQEREKVYGHDWQMSIRRQRLNLAGGYSARGRLGNHYPLTLPAFGPGPSLSRVAGEGM
jgi:hypothetical protein